MPVMNSRIVISRNHFFREIPFNLIIDYSVMKSNPIIIFLFFRTHFPGPLQGREPSLLPIVYGQRYSNSRQFRVRRLSSFKSYLLATSTFQTSIVVGRILFARYIGRFSFISPVCNNAETIELLNLIYDI